MLSDAPGRMIMDAVDDYVVFDLETTGLSSKKDEVIEISALKVVGGNVVDEFSHLVDPGIEIPVKVVDITGITDDMVKGCSSFVDVLGKFLEFAGDLVLAGQNIRSFDLKFLYRDADRFWGKTIGNDYVDTLSMAKVYLPELCGWSLADLAWHYGISTEGAHRAMADCIMTQKVYECLKDEIAHPSSAAKLNGLERCPLCGSFLRMKDGKFGPFWGCMGYPDCRYTRNA